MTTGQQQFESMLSIASRKNRDLEDQCKELEDKLMEKDSSLKDLDGYVKDVSVKNDEICKELRHKTDTIG